MFTESFNGVVGACRVITTLPANKRGKCVLVTFYEYNEEIAKQFLEVLIKYGQK